VQVEDATEASEDVKDDAEEGEKTGDANESTTKLTGVLDQEEEENTEPTEAIAKHDYTLLDSFGQFLYEDEDPLPILCGYYLKIME